MAPAPYPPTAQEENRAVSLILGKHDVLYTVNNFFLHTKHVFKGKGRLKKCHWVPIGAMGPVGIRTALYPPPPSLKRDEGSIFINLEQLCTTPAPCLGQRFESHVSVLLGF